MGTGNDGLRRIVQAGVVPAWLIQKYLNKWISCSYDRTPAALDLEVMGSDYFLLEDYAAADTWFTKSVELDPSDAQAQYYLGRAKYNEKHFEEAIRAFTAALKLDARDAKAADYLGLSYEALGKTGDALAAYRAAVAARFDTPAQSFGFESGNACAGIDNRPRRKRHL